MTTNVHDVGPGDFIKPRNRNELVEIASVTGLNKQRQPAAPGEHWYDWVIHTPDGREFRMWEVGRYYKREEIRP